jgi:hypothetical protein
LQILRAVIANAFGHRFHSRVNPQVDERGREQKLAWLVGANRHEEAVPLALCVVEYI